MKTHKQKKDDFYIENYVVPLFSVLGQTQIKQCVIGHFKPLLHSGIFKPLEKVKTSKFYCILI